MSGLHCIFVGVVLVTSYTSAEETLVTRFREEAPKKWEEYRSLLAGFNVLEDALIEDIDIKQETRDVMSVTKNRDGTRAISKISRNGGKETMKVDNPYYSFELQRELADGSEFSIQYVRQRQEGPSGRAQHSSFYVADSLYRIGWLLDFSKIISSHDFRVIKASQVTNDKRPCVQIEFEYRLTNPGPKQGALPKFYAGVAVFDPEWFWALREAKINMDDKSISRIEAEHVIETQIRNLPVVVEEKVRWFDLKGVLCQRGTWKFRWSEFLGTNKDFTLSAFGFPEPTFVTPSRNRMWGFAFCIILLIFCVGTLVRRRRQKHKAIG
jgi:hypothetical protein